MAKTALITGGSRGIGFGVALELAKAGYDVAVNGMRPQEQVSGALDQLGAYAGRVIYARGDVSSGDDRLRMVEHILDEFGSLNLLVNNAGMAPPERRDILEAGEESFDRLMEVNLKGPWFLTQLVVRHMIGSANAAPDFRAAVIFISSVSATHASVNRGDYCISKAGLSMGARLWAVRLGEYGIPVYEVRPGITRTDMTEGVREKYDRLLEEGLCLEPRWGTPEDVGKTVAALAEGSIPYATGQVITVDGGLSVPRL